MSLTEIITIPLTFETSQALATNSIEKRVFQSLEAQTGLRTSDVKDISEQRFEVTVYYQAKGVKGVFTKPTPSVGEGKTFDEALKAAAKAGESYDKKRIGIKTEKKFEAPYFLVDVRGRSTTKDVALKMMASQETHLKNRYGNRAVTSPKKVGYTVIRTKADYVSAGLLPQNISPQKIIKIGKSQKSFEEAESLAPANKDVKSTVYEGTHSIAVYGREGVSEVATLMKELQTRQTELPYKNPSTGTVGRDLNIGKKLPLAAGAPIAAASSTRTQARVASTLCGARSSTPPRSYSGRPAAHTPPSSPTITDYM